MKKYRIGMIGFGFMGRMHTYGYKTLPFYYDLPFEVEPFGICARSQETLDRAKKLGYSFFTSDAKELISHPDVDIVDISSPNIFHRDQLLLAMEAGKPIYCEKPVVSTLAETIEIERSLRSYSGISRVVFHNRFFPAMMKTKSLLDEGLLGEILNFRISYRHSGSLERNKPVGWKQEKGAGVLLDMGSHALDLAFWFCGKFGRVSAVSRILYPERPDGKGSMIQISAEDHITSLAIMKSGATGVVEASKISAGSEDELDFELYGTEGSVRYHSMEPNFLHFFRMGEKEKGFSSLPTVNRFPEGFDFPGPKFSIGWARAHIHSIYRFLMSLHSGIPEEPSLKDGLYNMRVCEAIKKAVESGEWVDVE